MPSVKIESPLRILDLVDIQDVSIKNAGARHEEPVVITLTLSIDRVNLHAFGDYALGLARHLEARMAATVVERKARKRK